MSHSLDPDKYAITNGSKFSLSQFDPGDKDGVDGKKAAAELQEQNLERMRELQDLLYADDRHSLLIILQAMDAAGKDGIIKHVMSGVNPQGCQVTPFKTPTSTELEHTYLWRCTEALPKRGNIGIFNRSYYEEVLIVKVHPEILEHQKLPASAITKDVWKGRYEDIRNFEQHLVRNGTRILKFFLYISPEEQKERFLERIDNPAKNWKFSSGDIKERGYWKQYMKAFEKAIAETATPEAPWYVVPANRKWFSRLLVSSVIVKELESLGLKYPVLPADEMAKLASAREALMGESGD